MPQMAPITVKKADGTTDVIFNVMAPSAGDKTPAIWRPASGTSVATRPEIRLMAAPNGVNNKRITKVTAVFPVIELTTSKVVDYISFTGEFKTPLTALDADVKEAIYQTCNIMASNLVKDSVASGFAPT